MKLEVIKEKGTVRTSCKFNDTYFYQENDYNGYIMYEGHKLVFALYNKRMHSLTEITTGGACVVLAEIEGRNVYESYLKVFLDKIELAKKEGRDFNQVISDYKEMLNTGKYIKNNIKPIELWQISLLL